MTKKKELSPALKAECAAAKALFTLRKNALGLTQAKIAEAAEISPAAVAMYLNGQNPLNAKFAAVLSQMLGEPVESFSTRLAEDLKQMQGALIPNKTRASSATQDWRRAGVGDGDGDSRETIEAVQSLLHIATPRSKKVIERIAALDQQQRLSDEDIKLLEQIIDRFSAK